jgi:hypothetical protein
MMFIIAFTALFYIFFVIIFRGILPSPKKGMVSYEKKPNKTNQTLFLKFLTICSDALKKTVMFIVYSFYTTYKNVFS